MFVHFLEDEDGAVSVDWTVLAAGVVGLGLATAAVVASGVEGVSTDVSDTVSGIQIRTAFASLQTLLSTDFSGAAGTWSGGNMVGIAGFGDVLQIGPGERAETLLSVPAGAQSATVTFDMLGIDDLSGVPATVYINGQAVAVYTDNHGNITTTDNGVAGVTVQLTQHYENDPMGGGSHGADSRATYTITVDNPGETLSFGVENGSDRPISEEFYAIDDLEITSA